MWVRVKEADLVDEADEAEADDAALAQLGLLAPDSRDDELGQEAVQDRVVVQRLLSPKPGSSWEVSKLVRSQR